jgi:hypothetical protein
MNKFLVAFGSLMALGISYAQSPPTDVWSALPPASDDRFSNPKSKLYAGPNGWWGAGQVRAVVTNPAKKPAYEYRGSFSYTSNKMFSAVDSATKMKVMGLDFGTEKPAPGAYAASGKPDLGQKKVQVSFADVGENKIRNWTSADRGGTVTVSQVNGFLYIKFRDVLLQPDGLHNTAELKHPMTVGFEGAIPMER